MTDMHGEGWWYDRLNKEYILVEDHAEAALADRRRYRIVDATIEPLLNREDKRTRIIRYVCAQFFIRIRYHPRREARLAWQFTGEPEEALEVLSSFAQEHDLAEWTETTFTDFGYRGLILPLSSLLSRTEEVREYLREWAKTRGVPG